MNEGRIEVPPVLYNKLLNITNLFIKSTYTKSLESKILKIKEKKKALGKLNTGYYDLVLKEVLRVTSKNIEVEDVLEDMDELSSLPFIINYHSKEKKFKFVSKDSSRVLATLNTQYPNLIKDKLFDIVFNRLMNQQAIEASYIRATKTIEFIDKLPSTPDNDFKGFNNIIQLNNIELYDNWKYKDLIDLRKMKTYFPTLDFRFDIGSTEQDGLYVPDDQYLFLNITKNLNPENYKKLTTTLEHELVHLVQDLLYYNKTEERFKKKRLFSGDLYPSFGMPSKKTNAIVPGIKKNKDIKDRYLTRQRELDGPHELLDTEFYSNFVDIYADLTDYINKYKNRIPDIKTLFNKFVSTAPRLKSIEENQPARYNKYISLLYSELQKNGYL